MTPLLVCWAAWALGSPQANVWDGLTSFVGRNLRHSPSARRRVEQLLREAIPGRSRGPIGPSPWYVWREEGGADGPRLLVFENAAPVLPVPSASEASFHRFTPDGLAATVTFQTGWRHMLLSAVTMVSKEAGGDVIVVRTALPRPATVGLAVDERDAWRQFYAFIGDRLALLRVEDEHGALQRNPYYAGPHLTIGPPVPQRTAEQWAETIASGDDRAVLEALTWLGGVHLDPDRPRRDNVAHEDIGEARLVAAARARPGVAARLAVLGSSPNRWISEAARLAAVAEYGPFW